MTANDPIASPTWYANIRQMFNGIDISHMQGQGVDLTSYEFVSSHAGAIYQQVAAGNMPPRPYKPWPADWVQTFLNWMTNNCPKGVPVAPLMLLAEKSKASRIRKEVTMLSADELTNLKAAFAGIMAKDTTDPNGYFVQAGYHWLPAPNTYCMHHVPGYNPWHRAYLLNFENALRSIPGCENVTLPYWDITAPFPDVLKSAPFDSYTLPEDIGPAYSKGYVTQRFDYPTIQQNLLNFAVTEKINRAMSKTDWEDFHGYFAGAPYNTIIAAHDSGHNSIGPTMSDQDVAAFDPVFWFFHCNWDRLFWQWQKEMEATDLNGLLSTINKEKDVLSYQTFTNPAVENLAPFTLNPPKVNTVATIDSENSLDVDYQAPKSRKLFKLMPKTSKRTLAAKSFTVNTQMVNVSVQGLNRLKIPGSFNVHLTKDGEVIASTGFFQPKEVDKCANCVSNAVVHFDFELPLAKIAGGKLGVWVEPIDKSFVGDRFPNKMMGNPTVEVNFMLGNE